jgi:hypothetical protein
MNTVDHGKETQGPSGLLRALCPFRQNRARMEPECARSLNGRQDDVVGKGYVNVKTGLNAAMLECPLALSIVSYSLAAAV